MVVVLPGRAALPSQRKHVGSLNPLPSSPEQWLKERQERDEKRAGVPPDLWMIHNKLYNLSGFLDRHPGGREWLEFLRGMDCTMEFETHHLDDDKMQKLLSKFYVRDADPALSKNVQAYTFEPDGFYKTIKRRAFKILQQHGGPSGGSRMEVVSAITISIWTLSFLVTCISGSSVMAALTGALVWPEGRGERQGEREAERQREREAEGGRERGRERERESGRERERERERMGMKKNK